MDFETPCVFGWLSNSARADLRLLRLFDSVLGCESGLGREKEEMVSVAPTLKYPLIQQAESRYAGNGHSSATQLATSGTCRPVHLSIPQLVKLLFCPRSDPKCPEAWDAFVQSQ